ncbi:ABC transporter substrate-binding protein [Stappia indica]|uniref:ABC transporter substrate-binding protein n=1 Tax=Stappia indica TaxID=538381 RepID=UPI001CD7F3F9|nr:extracellular solute-binding protein [Stappia indica]MCA1298446.1 extracellular solute-binding protein [Stappia indica]
MSIKSGIRKVRSAMVALTTSALIALPALAGTAMAGELVINTDSSFPAVKKAFQSAVTGFEQENPDIKVTWNVFDNEAYKSAIRNFLSAESPDLATWFAGNRMLPYVNAGLFAPIDDVWAENGLDKTLKAAESAVTFNGTKWAVPYTYYQWGVYYRKDLFAKFGIDVPTTWEEFKAAGAKLQENGVTPVAIGTKFPWTAAGWFDYLNLRTNGYDFHMAVTRGEIPWTDERIRKTMGHWEELLKAGFFLENHAAYSWQEALPALVNGDAGMYLMGNFIVAPLQEAGLTEDQLGFFQFPAIDPAIAMAEDAPANTLHLAAGARNVAEAKKFLAYIARADVQTRMNEIMGQLPVNAKSSVSDDPYLQAGFKMLSNVDGGLAQFFDRDASAAMAKAGMEGFQEFMVKPERLDKVLARLETVRQRQTQ